MSTTKIRLDWLFVVVMVMGARSMGCAGEAGGDVPQLVHGGDVEPV